MSPPVFVYSPFIAIHDIQEMLASSEPFSVSSLLDFSH